MRFVHPLFLTLCIHLRTEMISYLMDQSANTTMNQQYCPNQYLRELALSLE